MWAKRRRGPPWWAQDWSQDSPYPGTPLDVSKLRRMRQRFIWRAGFLFVLLTLFVCGIFAAASWIGFLTFGMVPVAPGLAFILRLIGIGLIIIALGALAFTFSAFRRAAAPVGDLIEAAGRVAEGDYSTRVAERGPREVRSLVHAFNSMGTRLQENDVQRRRLLADVTHELRTPLTVMQGNLEGMIDGVYPLDRAHLEPVLDETRQLARLI